jgi:aryl-alcohol dehydrogenase-like predicted oxidoreductase
MKNTILGRTGLSVSRIVYGGIVSKDEIQEDSDRYVSYAIEKGVNYFDVAPAYGNAQTVLGQSLIPHRKDIYLACKANEFSEEAGKTQFFESLKLLHTDYFDVYQLHALTNPEDLELAFSKKGIMNFLVNAKKDGLIRNLGFSAHNDEVACKATELYDFDTVLFPLNWSTHMTHQFGSGILELAKKNNMGVLALKSLALRKWKPNEENNYPKCWYKPIDMNRPLAVSAMKYTLSLGAHTLVPPGEFEYFKYAVDHIDECVNHPMTNEDMELLKGSIVETDEYLLF